MADEPCDSPRERRGTGDGTSRRAADAEAAMRKQWDREREDANRKSISNVRHEATATRAELRADIGKVSDASRERARELHEKIDKKTDKLDERVDKNRDDITALRSQVETFNKIMEKKDEDEFKDVPWYARPSYLKAMGLAIAAILAALIASLGIVFGWGGGAAPAHPDHHDPPAAEAPAEPGAAEGD